MPLPRFKVDPRPASSALSTHDVASVTRQHVGVAMLETFQFDGRLSLEVLKNEKSASAVIVDVCPTYLQLGTKKSQYWPA